MALVNVTNVHVLDNPTSFLNPFQFEITFECLQELQEDLEWKVVYVGSAESEEHDQVLEEVMVGPVLVGVNRFVLTSNAPNHLAIPDGDLLGVTVILLSCSYLDNKFLQIGYYVNNDYSEQYDPENPPNPIEIQKVFRNILANEPRVTRYPIDWTGGNAAFPDAPVEGEVSEQQEDGNDVVIDLMNSTFLGDAEGEDDDDDDMEAEEEDDDDDADVDDEEEIANEDSMDVEQMNGVKAF